MHHTVESICDYLRFLDPDQFVYFTFEKNRQIYALCDPEDSPWKIVENDHVLLCPLESAHVVGEKCRAHAVLTYFSIYAQKTQVPILVMSGEKEIPTKKDFFFVDKIVHCDESDLGRFTLMKMNTANIKQIKTNKKLS